MAKRADAPDAPECVHDEMEHYYLEGPPGAEAFAPGLEDLFAAGAMPEDTAPWRKRAGWIADLARRRSGGADQSDVPGTGAAAPSSAANANSGPQNTDVDFVALTGLRVLIVHPNLATRKQVASVLEQLGLKALGCGQTEQAILQVLHERPDAVLSEIDPNFDVFGLCRSLRDRVPEVPVLVVAPGEDETHYSVAMESGAADYLRRPITPALVVDRIRQAVGRARSGSLASASAGRVPAGGPNSLSRELRRQELKIQSLFELSKNVVGCVELDELYQGFLLNAMGQLGLTCGVLYHLDSANPVRPLEVVCRGISRRDTKGLLNFRDGLGAALLRAPQPLLLEERVFASELRAEVETLRNAGFGVACPMAAKGAPVGIALFGAKLNGTALAADDLVMLTAICNFAGPALEGARLFSELQRTYLSTVRAFVSSLEAKDAYTRGHSERVADYARVLGDVLGLSRRNLDMLVFGAVLHDIGKIGVPERILNKPEALAPDEWRIVREHPELGARIVSNIDYLEPAVGTILHHHERIDGRGYPHGLVGTDIELSARIVTVVDSFDAMTTNRPYRKGMSLEQAVRLLRGNAGRQFDPQITERFIDLLENGTIRPVQGG